VIGAAWRGCAEAGAVIAKTVKPARARQRAKLRLIDDLVAVPGLSHTDLVLSPSKLSRFFQFNE
jgi:hypothetical protein